MIVRGDLAPCVIGFLIPASGGGTGAEFREQNAFVRVAAVCIDATIKVVVDSNHIHIVKDCGLAGREANSTSHRAGVVQLSDDGAHVFEDPASFFRAGQGVFVSHRPEEYTGVVTVTFYERL